jgi:hypothetical protein
MLFELLNVKTVIHLERISSKNSHLNRLVLGEQHVKKSELDYTFKLQCESISEMSKDILNQVVAEMEASS